MSLSEDMSRLAGETREAYDRRHAAVEALYASADKQLADLHTQHSEMAAAQHRELSQFAEQLRRDVATLTHDLNVERVTLGAEQRRRLDAFTSDLRHTLDTFRTERAAERRAVRESQRQRLDDFRQSLRERTSATLADANATRRAIHTDHAAAQETWRTFNAEMRQRRSS